MSDSDYRWLNADSYSFLRDGYLLPTQTVDERVTLIAETAEGRKKKRGLAKRIKDAVKKSWLSFSTPIWSNFGTERGLPISCFGSHCPDHSAGIMETAAEVAMMSKYGGGTAVWFNPLRGRGTEIKDNGQSSGSVHFAQFFNQLIQVWNQGATRRGNCAGYWSIEHPDIEEVLTIRGEGSPIQHLFTGVTVSDDWMQAMVNGDGEKRRIWAKLIEARTNTGTPYVGFIDTVNRAAPDCYRLKGVKIEHSQLCSEIWLPTSELESFVCCLASANIRYFDEWKDSDLIETLVYLLDAVLDEFIEKAASIKFLERAVRFADRHRAVGIGWLGWHSYLQSKMVPFESVVARSLNQQVAKTMYDQAYLASAKLAKEFGETEVTSGFGRRHSTLLAIAPTKSSSFILGQVSEGIEPCWSNWEPKNRAKGKYSVKNPFLNELLDSKGKNGDSVWDSILKRNGSVQHLDFLSSREKEVFKTFGEISQMEVITQAAQRQKFVDQGQSLNVMIHPSTPVRDVNALMVSAWRLGVKALYYQHGANAAQEFSRNILACASCES